ncbi:hypothetical protein [Azospirillum brasilense]|uniref:hypothetical protein n=1 Tax=Azospirillum brasilense TaxID=192 RepID=UPI001478B877|nr:hypothetical protein [Azospirillum brasilense]
MATEHGAGLDPDGPPLHFLGEGAVFLQRGLASGAGAGAREMFHHYEFMDILRNH